MKTISGIEFASEHNGTDVFRLIELAYEQGRKDVIKQLPSALGTNLAEVGTDLISRAEAQTELQLSARRYTVAHEAHGEGRVVWSEDLISVSDAMDVLRKIPPAQPKLLQPWEVLVAQAVLPQPKMGKWIYHIDDLFPAESTMECNQCHAEQPLTCDDEFCPHCGAKMEVIE